MDSETVNKLTAVNRRFYQTFAVQFSDTRKRLQPGVRRIIKTIPHQSRILDLGCGNGELARELYRQGHAGEYIGLDFSSGLLEEARAGVPKDAEVVFLAADLSEPDWVGVLPTKPFDFILAFSVLHHLPGKALQRQTLEKFRKLLLPGGYFIHSNWQFLKNERLRSRIQPWEKINLTESDVDAGDYLLDWRRGGYGLRYVHHFSPQELQALALETGFRVVDTFYSDGQGGNLGLYQVWEKM
jgi:SAM-dependent methyltransferase